jgi:hypothetical protein
VSTTVLLSQKLFNFLVTPKPVKRARPRRRARLVVEQAKLFGARFSFLLDCSYLFALLLKGGRSL